MSLLLSHRLRSHARRMPACLVGAFALAALVATASSEVAAQTTGGTTICELKSGPRAGERERLRGTAAELPIGSACGDGRGSMGRVAAKDATSGLVSPPDSTRKHGSCYFERGLRAGHILRGVLPAPLGSQCHDREGNFGVIDLPLLSPTLQHLAQRPRLSPNITQQRIQWGVVATARDSR